MIGKWRWKMNNCRRAEEIGALEIIMSAGWRCCCNNNNNNNVGAAAAAFDDAVDDEDVGNCNK